MRWRNALGLAIWSAVLLGEIREADLAVFFENLVALLPYQCNSTIARTQRDARDPGTSPCRCGRRARGGRGSASTTPCPPFLPGLKRCDRGSKGATRALGGIECGWWAWFER